MRDTQLTAADFREPAAAARPKFRWSWPGLAVEPEQLAEQLAEMAAAGFGGAEIATLEFGLPPEVGSSLMCSWGGERWAERIGAALGAGRDLGLEVDLTIGPGWPWASPAVSGDAIELSQHELLRAERRLTEGDAHAGAPPQPDGIDPARAQLVAVTAARLVADEDGAQPAVLEAASAIDLTRALDDAGRLRWQAPAGDWLLFAFWQQPTLQRARSAIPNICEPPNVVDHMRRASAEAALRFLDERLLERLDPELRPAELFEDSLELLADGLYWTPAFLDAFRARRGYDPVRLLPALRREDPSAETPERPLKRYALDDATTAERLQRDYHQTVTDLWVDDHLTPMRAWANARGIRNRVQVYGGPFDNIALAMAVDVPETEDLYVNTVDFWRTIASGAHLSGAEKVSMEHGVVISADYMMTLRELKRRADKAFTAGVNQIVMCVYPYKDAEGMRWPTYAPWSSPYLMEGRLGFSEAWNGTNPQWPHLRPLGDYLGRAQALLRAGRPVADVAVYRDLYGYPTDFGEAGTIVPLGVDPPEPAFNRPLHAAGFVFDFVNPTTLADAGTVMRDGRLLVQEPGYGALVVELDTSLKGAVDHSRAMPGEVAQRLAAIADEGLPIVFAGRFPERGVSLRDADAEDAQVRAAVERLQASPNVRLVADGAAVPAALAELGVAPALTFDGPHELYAQHRRTADGNRTTDGDWWFLWNAAGETAALTASFAAPAGTGPRIWDLWSGDVQPAGHWRVTDDGRVELPLRIGPRETLVVGFDTPAGAHVVATDAEEVVADADGDGLLLRSTRGGRVNATLADGAKRSLDLGQLPAPLSPAAWDLHVEGRVPEGSDVHDLTLDALADWREIPQLRHSSGVGTYRTRVELDETWAGVGRGAYLELGVVHGGVRVLMNGQLATPACVAPQRIDVGPLLRAGENAIEVELTTTLKNRVDTFADQPAWRYLADRVERTQPYGLLGPVRLVPYVEAAV